MFQMIMMIVTVLVVNMNIIKSITSIYIIMNNNMIIITISIKNMVILIIFFSTFIFLTNMLVIYVKI